jgi:hypothetical protein
MGVTYKEVFDNMCNDIKAYNVHKPGIKLGVPILTTDQNVYKIDKLFFFDSLVPEPK